MTTVRVHRVVVDSIVRLIVDRPPQTDVAVRVPCQTALDEFHVTLIRLDELDALPKAAADLPSLPLGLRELHLLEQVYWVKSGEKQSCFLRVDQPGQELLRAYAMECAEVMGLDNFEDSDRVFHVTLSNAAGGTQRGSVGPVWAFGAVPIHIGREHAAVGRGMRCITSAAWTRVRAWLRHTD